MHRNLSSEATESLQGYDDLFEQTRKLFIMKDNDDILFKEMQKQIQIRHIFQHNRGNIRDKDIEGIKNQCLEVNNKGKCFHVLNEEGNPIPRGVGDDIQISQYEIQKLFDTIEKYSEAFLIQAKSAEANQ